MEHISVTQLRMVRNHPYLRALVDLNLSGVTLRGLRLEQDRNGELNLGYPGRKIQGEWQIVYQAANPATEKELLKKVVLDYQARTDLGREKAA